MCGRSNNENKAESKIQKYGGHYFTSEAVIRMLPSFNLNPGHS